MKTEWIGRDTTKGTRIKGKGPMEQPRTRWFSQVPEDINKRGKAGKKLKILCVDRNNWKVLLYQST
jgi:hypothetical protein